MDQNFREAMEKFLADRMDTHGTATPKAVSEAIRQVDHSLTMLENCLEDNQLPLIRDVEDALSLQTGEETRYYYRKGFSDGIRFLTEWKNADS